MARVVVAVAVELDGQAVFGPTAVDTAATCRTVCLGQLEPCFAEQVQKATLEFLIWLVLN